MEVFSSLIILLCPSSAIIPDIKILQSRHLHLARNLVLYFQVWLKFFCLKIPMSRNQALTIKHHVLKWRKIYFRSCLYVHD